MSISKNWTAPALLAILAGLAGGILGAFLSVAYPALSSSTTLVTSGALTITPGTPIFLLDKGAAHASVMVDRNGLIVVDLTNRNGRNQVALGVRDSKLQLGVFDSGGKPKAAMEIPMKDTGRVHMLLLDKNKANPGLRSFMPS